MEELDIRSIKGYIDQMKKSLAISFGQRQQLALELSELNLELTTASEMTNVLTELKAFFKTVSERARVSARARIEELGTLALQSVYGPDYGFEIDFSPTGRSGTEAMLYICSVQNGKRVRNQPNGKDGGGTGGGAIMLLALALRIGMMMSMDPPVDGPLVLDEPFKEIDEPKRILAINFLLNIARKFDMQIVGITHDPLIKHMASKKFDFWSENGYCYVTPVTD